MTGHWISISLPPLPFEKAIRGISIVLQGKFGTEGSLDQNQIAPVKPNTF